MNPEKQRLLQDLLADDDRRHATLSAGGRILRRRRHWRAARRTLPPLLLIGLLAFGWLRQPGHYPPPRQTGTSVAPLALQPIRPLADNELLFLFTNTPVGLITLPNGKKILVFPRPEDEKKYIIRI